MQTENDYDREVFNGDLGLVKAVDPDAQEVLIEFEGKGVVYDFGELDEVVLAYATTIHKSQGSEYPVVVLRAWAATTGWRASGMMTSS